MKQDELDGKDDEQPEQGPSRSVSPAGERKASKVKPMRPEPKKQDKQDQVRAHTDFFEEFLV